MPRGDGTDAQIAVSEKVCDEVRIEHRIGGRVEQNARFSMASDDQHSESAAVDQGV
ncbi:MAG TPA: hypothetical protein VJT16_06725 [Streptosporangiaceae bacterium]|nr:hypothetical protein [Streptosporangiaceae bacterium]